MPLSSCAVMLGVTASPEADRTLSACAWRLGGIIGSRGSSGRSLRICRSLRLGLERVRGPAAGGLGWGGEGDGPHARPAFLPAPRGQPLQKELRHRARARQPPRLRRARRRAEVEPVGVAEQTRDRLLELLVTLLQPAQRAAACEGEPAQRGAHAHRPREGTRHLGAVPAVLPLELMKLGLVRWRCTCQLLEHEQRRSTRRAAVAGPRLDAAWGGQAGGKGAEAPAGRSEAGGGGCRGRQRKEGRFGRGTDLPRRSGSSTTPVAPAATGGPSRHRVQAATPAGGSRA